MLSISISADCWLCRQPLYLHRHGICSYCLRNLPQKPCCCPRCGLPAASAALECGRCLLRSPPWLSLTFVDDYRPPLSGLIGRLKYSATPELAALLARLLLLQWLTARRQGQVIRPQQIVSVPLHHRRGWRRGFNQSDLLARPLARWLGCRYRSNTVRRIRATPAQQQLSAVQRRRNLRAAFRCDEDLTGRHIALLDDVVTTGSTVAEISRLLLRQGAESVQVWSICRTL